MGGDRNMRCAGCGKKLEPGQPSMRIVTGKVGDRNFKKWGVFHQGCFERVVESPRTVLDQVKRIARESRKVA